MYSNFIINKNIIHIHISFQPKFFQIAAVSRASNEGGCFTYVFQHFY